MAGKRSRTDAMKKHVVTIGAGFAGLELATRRQSRSGTLCTWRSSTGTTRSCCGAVAPNQYPSVKPLIPKHGRAPFAGCETDLIQSARLAVLAHFKAPPKEYVTIFTPSATGACRLVGEAYPFGPRSQLVLTHDNHNSVHGIREFASLRATPP